MKNKKFKFLVILSGAALAKPAYSYLKSLWTAVNKQLATPQIDLEKLSQLLNIHQDSIDSITAKIQEFSDKSQAELQKNVKRLEKMQENLLKLQKIFKGRNKDSIILDFPELESENSLCFSESLELSEICGNSTFIEDDSRLSARNNRLLKLYNPKIKSSLRLQYLKKSIESILSNKFKDDQTALERAKEPLTMPEYLYQSLFKESPVLADKKVCEILNTFKEHQNDPRVRFYCRLFQVFDGSPISYKLSLYLIKLRHFFNIFISKQVIPEALKKRVDKMQVIVILKSTRKLFISDQETGKVVLKHLRPESIPVITWTITCLEYYLYYKNMLPAECFRSISPEDSITEGEFIEGLSKTHETFIDSNELAQLFSSKTEGFMTLAQFSQLFDLDSFFKRNQTHMVDQVQFLNALIEGYSSMRVRHYKEVEVLINSFKKNKLNFSEAFHVIKSLAPGLDPEKVLQNVEEISAKDLRKKIFELNVAGMGIGCYNLKSIERISDVFDE
jgi:hypothetical protein